MSFFWRRLLPNPVDPGEDESPYYPFKREAQLGPGPMGETNERARKWDCRCSDYTCVCWGIGKMEGKRKVIHTDPERKRAYNKMYREWVAAGRPG